MTKNVRVGHYNIFIMKKHKAPGKSYRKGLSLLDLTRLVPDDETAAEWFVNARWPNGIACPHCGSLNVQTKTKHKTMPYRCRDCRKWFSVKTGTSMHDSKLGLRVWLFASYILVTNLKGVSSMKLHRDLGVTQKTAWHMAHRIRETWDEQHGLFAGPTEVDETYMGGKEKNKRNSKKINAGRGPVGKTPVAGAKDRKTNRVSATVIQGTTQEDLEGFIQERVEPGSTVYTDDHSGYNRLWLDFEYASVRHSVREYVKDQTHTNGIESFWALLKRGYYGTYHRMSEKHLQRYVNEFAGRHNIRSLDTIDQMASVAKGMDGKRLRYRDLVE